MHKTTGNFLLYINVMIFMDHLQFRNWKVAKRQRTNNITTSIGNQLFFSPCTLSNIYIYMEMFQQLPETKFTIANQYESFPCITSNLFCQYNGKRFAKRLNNLTRVSTKRCLQIVYETQVDFFCGGVGRRASYIPSYTVFCTITHHVKMTKAPFSFSHLIPVCALLSSV